MGISDTNFKYLCAHVAGQQPEPRPVRCVWSFPDPPHKRSVFLNRWASSTALMMLFTPCGVTLLLPAHAPDSRSGDLSKRTVDAARAMPRAPTPKIPREHAQKLTRPRDIGASGTRMGTATPRNARGIAARFHL
jgi:hypothetical protein